MALKILIFQIMYDVNFTNIGMAGLKVKQALKLDFNKFSII